jgi:hypothetical protein
VVRKEDVKSKGNELICRVPGHHLNPTPPFLATWFPIGTATGANMADIVKQFNLIYREYSFQYAIIQYLNNPNIAG